MARWRIVRGRASGDSALRVLLDRYGTWVGIALAAALLLAAMSGSRTSGSFTATIANSTDRVQSKGTFTCADLFAARKDTSTSFFEWALGEAATSSSGTSAMDTSDSANAGVYSAAHGADGAAPIACPNDTGTTAATLADPGIVRTSQQMTTVPNTFSLVIWFKTSQKKGRLLGASNYMTNGGSSHDRHIYLQPTGRLSFGVRQDTSNIHISSGSSKNYADGLWHLAVATMSSGGTVLYADGQAVASSSTMKTGDTYSGYWRVGYDQIPAAWIDAPTGDSEYGGFTGSVRFAAAYRTVLTADEVLAMWSIGKPCANSSPGTGACP